MILLQLAINFQSGEFYFDDSSWWIELVVNIIGALVGTFFALYFTLRFERRRDSTKRDEKHFEKLNFLSLMLENILKISQKQRDYFKEYFEKSEGKKLEIPTNLNAAPHTDLKWFTESFNREQYFHPFLQKFGKHPITVESYGRFFTLPSALYAHFIQFGEILKEGRMYDWERKKRYQQISENLLDRIAIESIKLNSVIPVSEFSQYLSSTFIKAAIDNLKNEEFDIEKYQSDFIDPQRKELKKFYPDEFALYIAGELRKMSVIFKDIVRNNRFLIDDLRQRMQSYETTVIDLEEISLNLREAFPNSADSQPI